MTGYWIRVMDGEFDERHVRLERYEPDGGFRVTTTQKETEISEPYRDGSSMVFGSVVSKGDKIELHSQTAADLVKELVEMGRFPEKDAVEIARHAENPPKPAD